ncbi:MAG TPA: tRNA (guanosine(37)-N1)-methyltransferase TrmD [Myxococcota bacterium]|nr:tRNA (guanosine(37)-N1)-methyltransferase TrmD [Myxococcota bacterium]HRY93843.1 tRNA (guanosine(37)-N1)-methyltransferase TrmD [Myxococcota bacterium]HSA23631.1 tRNA (guanosine(37)-N1)-methyltransferase TrmD [Myxococcota bacterium]
MRWTVLTLFPSVFDSICTASLFGKAVEAGVIQVRPVDIRDHAEGKHRSVDDSPFGGGVGMVLRVEPVARALEAVRADDPAVHVVLLTPQGRLLDQARVGELAGHAHVALLCGRYEGVDDRICGLVDEELSVGDYVLSGGEPAAWVVMDAVCRLVPGVLGKAESTLEESHGAAGLLEYPQYTRPREFRGQAVPEVLLSGDHAAIARWRRRQAIVRTAERRPDLLARADLSEEERVWIEQLGRVPGRG